MLREDNEMNKTHQKRTGSEVGRVCLVYYRKKQKKEEGGAKEEGDSGK